MEAMTRSNGVGAEIFFAFRLFKSSEMIALAIIFIGVMRGIELLLLVPLERRAAAWRSSCCSSFRSSVGRQRGAAELAAVVGPDAGDVAPTSGAGGELEGIGVKADIETRRSAIGGKADVPATWPESPLLAEAVEKVGVDRFCATIVPVG